MRYFEFHEPYYGLIPARTKAEAVNNYVKYVSEDPELEYMKEVPREYAFEKFAGVMKDEGKIVTDEGILKEFEDRENVALLVDGTLG
ncbi:MAG: hypothetical protein ACE3JK_01765 [Sporolactobacillus sp.]